MHGRGGGGEGRRSRHMRSIPVNTGAVAATPVSPRTVIETRSNRFANGFFLKDGREIHIGDCALFQSGNSPAFIGIIRSLSSIKEDFPKLIVNWLYRPADIKLAKGILLEAAPNEVFYSFHRDEISAESLLHPCKVAFLRKGVELSSGISSFVCRRVYDIANKCLWWLTDKDYINERQEEVDQLLGKTQIDMNAAVQSGAHSPKHLNGSTSAQQLKSSSDSLQNNSSSCKMHVKGKRRDKVDHNVEFAKRENAMKAGDGGCASLVLDAAIKDEVAKITDKGGLVDTTCVDKLISLMQLDKDDGRIDLTGRVLLADVIAATSTDRFECLGRFVQQKGLLVLDDWLQDAHKGKVGDCSSPKEVDKSFEELVLVLLRALDKLPVNLDALQTSNIGKSVNNLRSHRNLEIQKKARILVDTWKKRVNAEIMKTTDAKYVGSNQSVSWSAKHSMPEAAHGGNRRVGDATLKTSTQPSSTFKSLPVKATHGDAVPKSVTSSPGSKSAMPATYPMTFCTKDALSKTSVSSNTSDLQCTPVREDKSSSSSQSQNNNQASSIGPIKNTLASRRDDVRSSSSGTLSCSKLAGGLGRHSKSNNGFPGAGVSGMQKDSSLNKMGGVSRTAAANKISLPLATSDHALDSSFAEHANGHRLIVRLPNPGKSPAQSSTGVSFENLPVVSRAPSTCASEKHDLNESGMTIKGGTCQTNDFVEANVVASSDKKVMVASGESTQFSSSLHKNCEESVKPEESLKDENALATCKRGISFSESKSRKQYNTTLSPMNALIESCVKSPETSVSLSAGDELGMNLLASVATEEMLKCEVVGSEFPFRNSSEVDGTSIEKEDTLKLPNEIDTQGPGQAGMVDSESGKIISSGSLEHEIAKASEMGSNVKNNDLMTCQEHAATIECSELNMKSEISSVIQQEPKKEENSEVNFEVQRHVDNGQTTGGLADDNYKLGSLLEENKSAHVMVAFPTISEPVISCRPLPNVCHTVSALALKVETVENVHSIHANNDVDTTIEDNDSSVVAIVMDQKPLLVAGKDIDILNETEHVSSNCSIKESETCDVLEPRKNVCADTTRGTVLSENKNKDLSCTKSPSVIKLQSLPVPSSGNASANISGEHDSTEDSSSGPMSRENGTSDNMESGPPNCTDDGASKLDFDLNEGISADEACQGDVANVNNISLTAHCSETNFAPISMSSALRGHPVTITIAAPAKGSFMPPENPLRSRDEPGWKGSAATSAFRPAEPRKVLEMTVGISGRLPGAKYDRPPLNIDLNVVDSRSMDDTFSHCRTDLKSSSANQNGDMSCNVGVGLDLNKVDEFSESVQNGVSTSHSWEPTQFPGLPARGVSNGSTNGLRDFDLNDGPGAEASLESMSHNLPLQSSVLQFLPPLSSLRMGGTESGNMSSWFPSGMAYPNVAISPVCDRGDGNYPVANTGAQRLFGSAIIGSSFVADHFRTPVLSASPAIGFTSTNSFMHPGFQLPCSFPMNSTSFSALSTSYGDSTSRVCLPSMHTPLGFGPAAASSSAYIRPYVISLSDSSASGGGSDGVRKRAVQNLDLNAGPGCLDVDARAERLSTSSHSVFSEEVGRLYPSVGSGLKRKEPEGGWDAAKFSYRQSPWQ